MVNFIKHLRKIKINISNTPPKQEEYDGIYFVPVDESGSSISYQFFSVNEKYKSNNKIDSNVIGDSWHIAFFGMDTDGLPELIDTFDAVFADPYQYLVGLKNLREYGVVLRKTDKSKEWFDKWLNNVLLSVMRKKLNYILEDKK